MRLFNECEKENCCDRCINQIIENIEFEAKINLLKRQTPSRFGHMLPYYKVYTFCQLSVLFRLLYTLFLFLFCIPCQIFSNPRE